MRFIIILFFFSFFITSCEKGEIQDNQDLLLLLKADIEDRSVISDISISHRDDLRRKRVFELLAQNKVITPKDKYNAAIILQHTGMFYENDKLKSKSYENYFLASLLARSAYSEGFEKAKHLIAVTYDRYSWMAFGFQKYGTQSTFIDNKEVWVTIDPATTDKERAEYNIPPLKKLLKLRSMQKKIIGN